MSIAPAIITQQERDTYGPPNRCSKNKNRGQCKEAVCRNINGTWSVHCEKHKKIDNESRVRSYAKRAHSATEEGTSEEENDDNAPAGEGVCVVCGGPTRPKKNGPGFVKTCDDCSTASHEVWVAILKYKRAKREWATVEEEVSRLIEERRVLQNKRMDIEDRVSDIDRRLDGLRTVGDAVKQAKQDVDTVMDF